MITNMKNIHAHSKLEMNVYNNSESVTVFMLNEYWFFMGNSKPDHVTKYVGFELYSKYLRK